MKNTTIFAARAAATASILALTSLSFVAAPVAAQAGAATAPSRYETAVFAGGCFWGIDAVFDHIKGVRTSDAGYAGGTVKAPSYEQVSSGATGHAESVRVVFDPTVVTYAQLLQVFFSVAHDPTQLNRQGPDTGTQYRSAIFYTSPAQKIAAESYIAQMTKAKTFSRPIVTQVAPLGAFNMAEDYHQNYLEQHPDDPYIVQNDQPKVANLRKEFPQLYKAAN